VGKLTTFPAIAPAINSDREILVICMKDCTFY
jgi:hypothetical protein